MRTHTGAKLQHVWQHVCSECGKGFHQASSLQLHGLTHTAQMDHVCLDCGNAYSKESSLRAHLLTHPADRLQAASTDKSTHPHIHTPWTISVQQSSITSVDFVSGVSFTDKT